MLAEAQSGADKEAVVLEWHLDPGAGDQTRVQASARRPLSAGGLGREQPFDPEKHRPESAEDRRLATALGLDTDGHGHLPAVLADELLPRLAATSRLWLERPNRTRVGPLVHRPGPAFTLALAADVAALERANAEADRSLLAHLDEEAENLAALEADDEAIGEALPATALLHPDEELPRRALPSPDEELPSPAVVEEAPSLSEETPAEDAAPETEAEPSGPEELHPVLKREGEVFPLEGDDWTLVAGGWIIAGDELLKVIPSEIIGWLQELRLAGPLELPTAEDAKELVERAIQLPSAPEIEARGARLAYGPVPRARVAISGRASQAAPKLAFLYGETAISQGTTGAGAIGPNGPFLRHPEAERRHEEALKNALEALPSGKGGQGYKRAARLAAAGFEVEVDRKRIVRPTSAALGLDDSEGGWLVEAVLQFGEAQGVPLADVITALEKGEDTIRLPDGSIGLLPENLSRARPLLATATKEGKKLRYSSEQGWLLEALARELDAPLPEVDRDQLLERMRTLETIEPRKEPRDFQGTLRPYQREGLGWLTALYEAGVGGCLADDMGLGKTVQVLAMLGHLQAESRLEGPVLVVAPRSVVPNWLEEAGRFLPSLPALELAGTEPVRQKLPVEDAPLIVTSYGILRSDAERLAKIPFSLVVLDEAQAIKNHRAQVSRAARSLQAHQRLALSGTPVENHLGELWALFEFLVPGLLGRSRAFQAATAGPTAREGRELLARALRPFVLRRTKGQVAQDLPERIEQTITVRLEGAQADLYGRLAAECRRTLLGTGGGEEGSEGRGLDVLTALLRLRQAACHPALVPGTNKKEVSAKLEALVPLLKEVAEEGHKALVFSQFTSLLDLVGERLREEELPFVRLDGSTRDRAGVVHRFQNEPDLPVFLLSLRAGGTGLNLTAADYVFILDPWWNPAVEAQAVDRAHRIGRKRRVVAYRLVAQGTVEERILELQKAKRDLADAVISAEGGPLKGLDQKDLELLLG